LSYDLFLRPRKGAIGKKDFEAYFRDRRFYEAEAGHASYRNEDTGVYFSFEWVEEREDDEEGEFYPIAFNINYFRPSYFIVEAEIEVSALVQAFDLVVDDPQWKGMGKGEYDAKVLMSGWNAGNESAYGILLETPEQRSRLRTLPSATLLQAWRWNLERDARQRSVGDTKFVPLIQFIEVEGQMTSAMVWPDGAPLVAAPVDWLILAGENLLRRRPDFAGGKRLLPWAGSDSDPGPIHQTDSRPLHYFRLRRNAFRSLRFPSRAFTRVGVIHSLAARRGARSRDCRASAWEITAGE
jgi:hypothetical protein